MLALSLAGAMMTRIGSRTVTVSPEAHDRVRLA
jgi:hypothetical protein